MRSGTTDRLRAFARGAATLILFAAMAVVMTWPLVLNLNTHVLGDLTGDTGVYVWNLWIFRHELLRHGHLPFSTAHIFAFTGGADFALHNYTAVAGLLGAPLIAAFGLVATFNLLMLAAIATAAYGMFLLARYLGVGTVAAWTAGVVFAAAPALTSRQTAHFSLVIAAPLPLFVLTLLRTLTTLTKKDAAAVGVLCAVASYCDAYYGVYCLLMAIVVIVGRFGRLNRRNGDKWRKAAHVADALIVVLLTVVTWRAISGVTQLEIGPLRIGLQTLYTPMLAIVILSVARCLLVRWPAVDRAALEGRLSTLIQLGAIAVTTCLILLTPILVGIAFRFWNNRLPGTEIFWRSSPRGVDLLSYLVPNPNHPFFGDVTRHWLLPDNPDAFPEFIASFSIVASIVIGLGTWRRRLPRQWVMFAVFFVLLSLGPFVHIGGINTNIPGPWAFLRYVPIIGMARSPSRFAIVAALSLSLLFGFAVDEWLRMRGGSLTRRRLGLAVTGVALVIELAAVPRPLYSAAVPDVYRMIATTDEQSGRLLELPTGVRDGTSSIGDFNASTQYFQTVHRRPLIGGYLSRVSHWRRAENLRSPVLRTLFALGEGHDVPAAWREEAVLARDDFLARSCVRYVIVNKQRARAPLRNVAVEILRLRTLHEDSDFELLSPVDPPACEGSDRF